MSVHAARALIGWKMSYRSCYNYCITFIEGGENHDPPRFCIVNVLRGGWKLSVLQLHHGATLQSTVEATVDLHCETVCFNQLFGDVIIFHTV